MIYINIKPLKYDNCKDCIRTCEHSGKDREFCYSKNVPCKKAADKIDNTRKQAVKEFAEKLKKQLNLGLYAWLYAKVDLKTIDELLKEYEK